MYRGDKLIFAGMSKGKLTKKLIHYLYPNLSAKTIYEFLYPMKRFRKIAIYLYQQLIQAKKVKTSVNLLFYFQLYFEEKNFFNPKKKDLINRKEKINITW